MAPWVMWAIFSLIYFYAKGGKKVVEDICENSDTSDFCESLNSKY